MKIHKDLKYKNYDNEDRISSKYLIFLDDILNQFYPLSGNGIWWCTLECGVFTSGNARFQGVAIE